MCCNTNGLLPVTSKHKACIQELILYCTNFPSAHYMLKLGFFSHIVLTFMVLTYGIIIVLKYLKGSKLPIRMPIDVYLASKRCSAGEINSFLN